MADVELAERLRASMGALVRAARARPEAMPEHRAQTLGFLMREGALTAAELAERRRVRHQTMQAAVTELEQEGLVERGPDPRDQRARLVGLTPAGRAALADELQRRSALLASAIDAELDDEERALLARVPGMLDRIAGYVAAERDG
jgi:DNA-binding MarR family transcriptional regulator